MDDTPPSGSTPAGSDSENQAAGAAAITDFPASRPSKVVVLALVAGAVAILGYLLMQ
jgi:hypothetical protein